MMRGGQSMDPSVAGVPDIPELVQHIAQHIDSAEMYGNFCLVSRGFYHGAAAAQPGARFRLGNHLGRLLDLYPDKPWSWLGLSYNINITWDYVVEHPQHPWAWNT